MRLLNSKELVCSSGVSGDPKDAGDDALQLIGYRHYPRWCGNILLLLFTTVLCLVVVEILIRFSESTTLAKGVPWSDRPAFYYKAAETPSFSNLPHSPTKLPGGFRVAVVGDSFTFPTYMQFDDAYPARLERMLRLSAVDSAAAARVEVLNFGRKGLSTRSELKVVKRALMGKPDLLILQITLNDPQHRAFHTLKDLNLPNYTFGELEITPETHPILYYWKTLGWIATRIHNSRTRESLIRYHQQLFADPASWQPFAAALSDIKRACDAKGVKLVALVFPMFFTRVDAQYPFLEAHAKIGGLLQELNVPVLDLRSKFENIPPDRLHVMPGVDSHPNELVHRRVAEELYLFLEQLNALPPEVILVRKFLDRSAHPKVLAHLSRSAPGLNAAP